MLPDQDGCQETGESQAGGYQNGQGVYCTEPLQIG